MGTRAMFSFIDEDNTFHVYMHWDGYPSNAAASINNALTKAWKLPRFEADEFAAAFVAANKTGEGNIRLLPSGTVNGVAPPDIEYRYEVSVKKGQLHVRALSAYNDKQLFNGTLAKFCGKFPE